MAKGAFEMSDTILEIKNINRTYRDEDNMVEALKDINFSIKEGEFVSIIGSSGCGKTTLLRLSPLHRSC